MSHSPRRSTRSLLGLLLVLSLAATGCETIQKLRRAQSAYQAGVALEAEHQSNQLMFVTDMGDHLSPDSILEPARTEYLRALDELSSITATEDRELAQDGLWVTKETVRALCLWRLGRTDEAGEAARAAVVEADAVAEPRDRAILLVLPGLIMNDQAYAMVQDPPAEPNAKHRDTVDQLLWNQSTGAVHFLNQATTAAGTHPISTYLLQVRVIMKKNDFDAVRAWPIEGEDHDAEVRRRQEDARSMLTQLEESLKLRMDTAEAEKITSAWARTFGISL